MSGIVICYFVILLCIGNWLLIIMWDVLEMQGYAIYWYDWILYFLLLDSFIYLTIFIRFIWHPGLNVVILILQVFTYYIILASCKEKTSSDPFADLSWKLK
jgi:hypothetical protein